MDQEIPVHPSGIIPEAIIEKVFKRRGRLHAFPTINTAKTALVVIDLDLGTGRDRGGEVTRRLSANVNLLADAIRTRGGVVAWVTTPIQEATENFRAVFGGLTADDYERMGRAGGEATKLWPELMPLPSDIHTTKQGHSAFFPGKSPLHSALRAKDIESVVIVGAVTNVCCEASARDAAELQYKVTMISDALIGQSAELDRAALTTFFRCYGDVRTTRNILEIL